MENALNARALIPSHDVLFITLDTLRYDVAQESWRDGETPNFARLLPHDGWEARHSPGSFTYASHQAFFAGFLPTPSSPDHVRDARLFACRFAGSETTGEGTCVLDAPDIVSGLSAQDYHTVCIGGVGFFNKQTPLGNVLPGLFHESHWLPQMGVTDAHSTEYQVQTAVESLNHLRDDQPIFLFVNISALHQPNCIFAEGATNDSIETQKAALRYVDEHLPPLFVTMQKRRPVLAIICSDHGTAYGEDGFQGHRLAHPVVWTVPYTELVLPQL